MCRQYTTVYDKNMLQYTKIQLNYRHLFNTKGQMYEYIYVKLNIKSIPET